MKVSAEPACRGVFRRTWDHTLPAPAPAGNLPEHEKGTAESRAFRKRTSGRKRLLRCLLFDVLHHVADGLQLLCVFVRNLDVELLFERHHEFNSVERVGTEIL